MTKFGDMIKNHVLTGTERAKIFWHFIVNYLLTFWAVALVLMNIC